MMHNMYQGHFASMIYMQNNFKNQILSAEKASGQQAASVFGSEEDEMAEKGSISSFKRVEKGNTIKKETKSNKSMSFVVSSFNKLGQRSGAQSPCFAEN